MLVRLALLALALANASADELAQSLYEEDPAIVEQLQAVRPGQSLELPPVKVAGAGVEPYKQWYRNGPGQRDYCNKMPYAADRGTALYAGGNHAVPHRLNDVWEFHLGSNTWHLLYGPDGGNPGKWKAAYFLTSQALVKNSEYKFTETEQKQIDGYRQWWQENVVFEQGHLTTKQGGPIMPAHTWDALAYDAQAKKLLWGMGVNAAGKLATHAYYTGIPREKLEAQVDPHYTPMWMFDPAARKWTDHKTAQECPKFRGMGATLCWLSDRRQMLWYVAAQNVTPPAYEMWLFDVTSDEWLELKPNGGKSIGQLATVDKAAPLSELQTAYSPRHGKLVAVLKNDTFVYDLKMNEWTKAVTDERIRAHDATSVFAYDSATDTFLLAFPAEGRGKQLSLAAFSLDTNRWQIVQPDGPEIPATQYGSYMGYFDERHEVFVVQGRNRDHMWAYRHKPRKQSR
jgi:hypothetical protein